MNLNIFKSHSLFEAMKSFFQELNVPISEVTEDPANPEDIVSTYYNEANPAHALINTVYFLGMVNEKAFTGEENTESLDSVKALKHDYDGLLIFGIELKKRNNGLNPTRSQLAEITRLFNREFNYTPVTLIFKYGEQIAFSNSERLTYKQQWREGEKVGKVSLLRDIDIEKPHTGHLKILEELRIPKTGKEKIDSFSKLYEYWQRVFNVSILNKQFYNEIQKWYFWAVKEVKFPNAPNRFDFDTDASYDAAFTEHKSKNVIRLLTRILFIWFIKEKNLIPEELFNEKFIETKLLKDFVPQKPHGIFATGKQNSMYYRAILQNLFFATLNQEMGKRVFRKDKKHQNITNLMRYQDYFKGGGDKVFVELMEKVVPFMNGGLFECLDKPHPTAKGRQGGDVIIYEDGFSDRNDNELEVPDFLFFDVDEDIDISNEMGSKNKVFKQTKTRGLLEILQSYKFTIAENTPVEEDVALDPELLGRVFENLLASYNPETKTTARKQTGSFYTPREIVNYMVDESLIAYLKNKITNWQGLNDDEVDKNLHKLLAFDNTVNPFDDKPELQTQIIKALDTCKILDPACGSGAFPMGVLQKMTHILYKVDSNNTEWKQRQIERVNKAIASLEEIDDSDFREKSIIELEKQKQDIEEAFANNELDYGRKLYLIENCIYGVDIQSIAIQISKLRFFISLIVDQKIDVSKANYGVRPLPNLETKFVAANTLIGIEKPDSQLNIFDTEEVKKLEKELKAVRHKLFSSKSPKRKRELREEDKSLRTRIAALLEANGMGNQSSRQLAEWDPYDQNASSPFFNPEWMFGLADGFDVVIGNPPYIKEYTDKSVFNGLRNSECYQGKMDFWYLFGCKSIDILKEKGITSFIATNNWVTNEGASKFRNKVLQETVIKQFLDFRDFMIFESASIQTMVYVLEKNKKDKYILDYRRVATEKSTRESAYELLIKTGKHDFFDLELFPDNLINERISFFNDGNSVILNEINKKSNFVLDKNKEVAQGIVAPQDCLNNAGALKLNNQISAGSGIFNLNNEEKGILNLLPVEESLIKPFYTTNELSRYYGNANNNLWVIYTDSKFKNPDVIKPYPNIKNHLDKFADIITSDNKPYGLHRARNEYFFQGEKIISLRKCVHRPTFTYTDFDCYVSQTYFIIKTNRINQKYLTALLNSKLIAFWLRNKGKMQGNAYQVDKGPILEIPLHKPSEKIQKLISKIVNLIIVTIPKNNEISIFFESVVDALIFNLYFPEHMQERKIDVLPFVERDIDKAMQGRDFENLNDAEKEQVIEHLHQCWTDPDNEVVQRMAQFKEKSPDILKVIMEG